MLKNILLLSIFLLSSLSAADQEKWISLFNGKDLSGWEVFVRNSPSHTDEKKYFQVHNGNMHFYKDSSTDVKQEFGVIQTKQEFSHYKLRFEYLWGTKRFKPRHKRLRDTGLLIHAHETDRSKWRMNAWPISMECQIQETDVGDLHFVGTNGSTMVTDETFFRGLKKHPVHSPKGTKRFDGQIGNRVLKYRQHDKLYNWNVIEAEVTGNRAKFYCNGEYLMEVFDMKKPLVIDGKTVWKPLTQGKISFQLEGAEVMYRNIEVQLMPEDINNKKK
ncbi:MAG: DUF1080 domain-containing protein [Lentisphaeraceae bacterium]|nr:DUF1080 domain-containing protein [Lentisphaeraceae bacterium]